MSERMSEDTAEKNIRRYIEWISKDIFERILKDMWEISQDMLERILKDI